MPAHNGFIFAQFVNRRFVHCGCAHRRGGFTLVEMAVVLTVIALVVGGIMVGKTLIDTAELQSVISDVNRFKQAAKLFSDKYKYLPGDFPNAEQTWGALSGCPDTAASDALTKSTCNGNGNGFIGGTSSTPSLLHGTSQEVRESIRVWQHLANGGFIEGLYSGTPSANDRMNPGVNIPKSSYTNGAFTLHFASRPSASAFYKAEYNHVIVFGCAGCQMFDLLMDDLAYLTIRKPALAPLLTPDDAMRMDAKADDGKPASGAILSFPNTELGGARCSTSSGYSTQYTTRNCSLIFLTGF